MEKRKKVERGPVGKRRGQQVGGNENIVKTLYTHVGNVMKPIAMYN